MKAMLTTKHGDRSVLKLEKNYPDPVPKSEEVVIKVSRTAVNFHDIFTRRGMPGVPLNLPVVVGSDVAGVVHSIGVDVDDFWLGKRILVNPVSDTGMLGETYDGGRAELMSVHASQLLEIPKGVSFDDAASLPLAYGTAWRMMVTQGQVSAGDTVLVLGASGGVGVGCVQIAKIFGATVIACASTDTKIQRLKDLGADHVVNYVKQPFHKSVYEIVGKPHFLGDGGVDMAINFTGGDTMINTQKCVKAGGRILTCGATAGYDLHVDARYWWTFEHRMIGSNGWETNDLVALLDMVDQKKLKPVIDKVLPLEQSAEAERMLEDREVFGKVLIQP